MISTNLSYGAHHSLQPFSDLRVSINRYGWKTHTNIMDGATRVVDATDFSPVPESEAALVNRITDELGKAGLRTLNNNHGQVSTQMERDVDDTGLNLWYHLTDATGSVSLSTYQAHWNDLNDRIDAAVGVLMSIDPASVAKAVEDVDAAIVPLLTTLLEIRSTRALSHEQLRQ